MMPNQCIMNVKIVLITGVTGDGNNQDIGLLWSGGNRVTKFRETKDFRTCFCGSWCTRNQHREQETIGKSEKYHMSWRHFSFGNFLPRVLNKLTICVYPMSTIMPEVSSITGLDNYNLTGQDKFTKSTGDLLNAFLSRLPFPVCLVAHNGNAYDFPLLRAELVKAGAEFGPNIFCVDSCWH